MLTPFLKSYCNKLLLRLFVVLFCMQYLNANTQNLPLGTWTAHLPLKNALAICQSKNYVYAACEYGVIGVNKENNFTEKYTKVDGLAEVFVSQINYDTTTSSLIIAYSNANIDIIQNGKITNIPYLKNATITGNKNINYIFCHSGIAYMACGFGVLKLDLVKKEVAETYLFANGGIALAANAIWANEQAIYAATEQGVYKGNLTSNINLLNFNNWQLISALPSTSFSAITSYQQNIIAATGNSIYKFDGTTATLLFTESNWITKHLNNANGQLQIAQQKINGTGDAIDGRIGKWNGTTFAFFSSHYNISRPLQIIEDENNNIWFADVFTGLIKQNGGSFDAFNPNGPNSITSREMEYYNNTLWVTSSNIRNGWNPSFNKNGIYQLHDGTWTNMTIYNTPTLDTFFDIAVVKAIPTENKLIFGSQTGILEYDINSTSFSINKYRPNVVGNNEKIFRITGADIDTKGNVWLSDAFSNVPIICRKADGNYTYFNTGFLNGRVTKDILVDDYNQIWVAKEDGGGGLVILNYGNDIDDKSDDTYFNLAAGSGYGNLPANNVICMAKDLDGTIWIGTTQGIAYISCAAYVIDNACEADQVCIDRNDGSGFCDNLLEDEIINCITVDAGNRKWIGTNNGLFLVSPDGKKTIHYFNENNSPLLANYVRSVTINPENGEVYIGTEKGICSYRAEATVTTYDTEDPFVYPNPVRADYNGLIAIKGIPNNCNVKIVDVSGNLVFETTATGGQATWDGNLINGNRAATGIYYALCKGNGKKETAKVKFVLFK